LGISYDYTEDKSLERMYVHSKNIILAGRKIKGEPEDFNF